MSKVRAAGEVRLYLLSGIGKSDMPQVYLLMLATVPENCQQPLLVSQPLMYMLTSKCSGHRFIACIRPQTADPTPPLVACDLEAIVAKSLQHGEPGCACSSSISNVQLHSSKPGELTSADDGDCLLPHCRSLTSQLSSRELGGDFAILVIG